MLRKVWMFVVGGAGYIALEYLWRGKSHVSMFLAGGLCFLLLGKLHRTQPRLPFLWRGLAGAGIITAVELLVGLLFNRSYQVWDYRGMPLNFCGQVCLPFSLLWIPLSWCAMLLYEGLENAIKKEG